MPKPPRVLVSPRKSPHSTFDPVDDGPGASSMMLGHFGDINFTRRGRRVLTDTKCRTGDRDATMYLNDTPGGRRSIANAWLRGRTLPPTPRHSRLPACFPIADDRSASQHARSRTMQGHDDARVWGSTANRWVTRGDRDARVASAASSRIGSARWHWGPIDRVDWWRDAAASPRVLYGRVRFAFP